jgi:hypothetical protein
VDNPQSAKIVSDQQEEILMTTHTPLCVQEFIMTLLQELASDLSLTPEQVLALEELEVNHHRRGKEPIIRQMAGSVPVTNGYYHYESPTIPICWRHIYRVGKIVAPDDGSVWSIQVKDTVAGKIIYSVQNLRANEKMIVDYSPGFTMRMVIDMRCISDANKIANVEIEGELRLG